MNKDDQQIKIQGFDHMLLVRHKFDKCKNARHRFNVVLIKLNLGSF